VIGFAAIKIIDVLKSQDAEGTPAKEDTCTKNNTNVVIPAGSYDWITFANVIGCSKPPPVSPVDLIKTVSISNLPSPPPPPYAYDESGITLNVSVPRGSTVSFTWHMNATPGPCGPMPADHSAKCVITQWLGSTLTGDYPSDHLDNVRVVRLCDLAEGTCLDQ
jgi:hypothetical protein